MHARRRMKIASLTAPITRWPAGRPTRLPLALALSAALAGLLPGLPLPGAQAQEPPTYYINVANPSPAYPYTNWATAATNIQDAVNASAVPGRLVLVTNGVYQAGTVEADGPNRVALTNVTLRSVSGPELTIVDGARAVRCVYLGTNATLSGFTLRNGRAAGSPFGREANGGGVLAVASATVTNCVLASNFAQQFGGGAFGGNLLDCTLTANRTGEAMPAMPAGGGAAQGVLSRCRLYDNVSRTGGGASWCTLSNCILIGNSANRSSLNFPAPGEGIGGGVHGCTLYNCALSGNWAGRSCGAAIGSKLYNCTLIGNTALERCGGVGGGPLTNCVVYFNEAPTNANWDMATFANSCTTPLPPGAGNIAADPQLASDTHLSSTSPCLRAGDPKWATGVDIDGEAWAAPPAMGADQVWPGQSFGSLTMQIHASATEVAVGFPVSFTARNVGPLLRSVWDLGDGTVLTNQAFTRRAWGAPGSYTVRLTGYNDRYPEGVTATVQIKVTDTIHYVNAANASPTFPYTTWATAATTIQDAVNASSAPGRTVLVTNGVHQTGISVADGSNRVVLAKAVLRSVNGPRVTVIDGSGAMRCVWLGEDAILSGFTLRNGRAAGAPSTSEVNGGGVMAAASAMVTNCVLAGNSAQDSGGGAFGGTLHNCILTGNTARSGGGTSRGTLHTCTLTSNVAEEAGGAASGASLSHCTLTGNMAGRYSGGVVGGALHNCVVYFNRAPDRANWDAAAFEHSCTMPLPPGPGNIAADPQLASATHLSPASPCLGGGDPAWATGVDIDGEAWADPPAMGADQLRLQQAWGELTVEISTSATEVAAGSLRLFTAHNRGPLLRSTWDLGDGTVLTNQPFVTHAWTAPGSYTVRLTGYSDSHPEGVSTSVPIQVIGAAHYVNAANPTPIAPYTSWATAARTIQDAVNASRVIGRLVLVTNGVYQTGVALANGTNRVALTKVTLRSVNGPEVTLIDGGGTVRCLWLGADATISGFTLRNGRAVGDQVMPPPLDLDTGAGAGGGVWSEASGTVTNCILTGNVARSSGGGAYGGVLYHCTFSGNVAESAGGGACRSTLHNCTLTTNSAYYHGGAAMESTLLSCVLTNNAAGSSGGAVRGCTLHNCHLAGNTASTFGGGAAASTLHNCTLTGNTANSGGGASEVSTLYNCQLTGNSAAYGGGASGGTTLHNCVLTGNSAAKGGGVWGGGTSGVQLYHCTVVGNRAEQDSGGVGVATLYNCIVYFNQAPTNANWAYSGDSSWSITSFGSSCTTPLPPGQGNIVADPGLASMTHLLPSSPCIGAGNPAWASGVDIDGEPWADPPAMGADQVWPGEVRGPFSVQINARFTDLGLGTPGLLLMAQLNGPVRRSVWDFGDGTFATNQLVVTRAWPEAASSPIRLTAYNDSHPQGLTAELQGIEGVHYVNAANPTPVAPYATWATAATNIQDAVNACTARPGLVLVTNGVYRAGTIGEDDPSVVSFANVLVRSVNGPAVTMIDGGGELRCANVGDQATLSGFTLRNGLAGSGGGTVASAAGVVTNCVLTGNVGGGAYGGTLYHCMFSGNSGVGATDATLYSCVLTGNSGGGANRCSLYNCTLTGNSGYGVDGGSLHNCIVYFNEGRNWADAAFEYCCTTPLPPGSGNIADDPQLASATHLSAASPCLGAGSPERTSGVDLDGEPWADPPAMGADQVWPSAGIGPLTMQITASFTEVAAGFPVRFTAENRGSLLGSVWDFGDGTVVTNQAFTTHAWKAAGAYTVRLTGYSASHPQGVVTSAQVQAIEAVHYVNGANPTPVFPYTSWATAATNIQDAVNVSTVTGRSVLVTNGVYQTGTVEVSGLNRVALTNVVLRSVNGPAVTIIDGAEQVRCVTLEGDAILSGFTLRNGASYDRGAGVLGGISSVVTNCVLTGNRAGLGGGGADGGTLYHCTLTGNSSHAGGGVRGCTLYSCALTGNSASIACWGVCGEGTGGAACDSTLYNCTLLSNSVVGAGGAAYASALYDCSLTGNSASSSFLYALGEGGAAANSTLCNCTLTGNSADWGGGVSSAALYNCTLTGNSARGGGGAYGSTLYNCIVYFNQGGNWFGNEWSPVSLQYCCTTPLPPGPGNLDADPAFVNAQAGDFRLRYGSPCIDAGAALDPLITHDLAGLPRPLDGNGDGRAVPDLGAYEFDLRTVVPAEWFTQHNLDASDPYVLSGNPDEDGQTSFQEWLAGTDPRDPLSFFRIEAVDAGPPVRLSYRGLNGRAYSLYAASELVGGSGELTLWAPVPGQLKLPGSGGLDALTDTNAPRQRFYRVGVESP